MSNTYRRMQQKKNGSAVWKITDFRNGSIYDNCSNKDLVRIVSDASVADCGEKPAQNEFLEMAKMNSLFIREGGKWFMPMFPYLDIELVKSGNENLNSSVLKSALNHQAPIFI